MSLLSRDRYTVPLNNKQNLSLRGEILLRGHKHKQKDIVTQRQAMLKADLNHNNDPKADRYLDIQEHL